MKIESISNRIFKTNSKTNQNENCSRQTNPFGVNFKGKMINADFAVNADVFARTGEVAKKRNLLNVAALVGSINSFGSAVSRRLDSVVNSVANAGRRIKDTTSNAWKKANEIVITPSNIGEMISRIADASSYSPRRLSQQPVDRLKELLRAELEPQGAA